MLRKSVLWMSSLCVFLGLGCGPADGLHLATVTGTVTLEGQPVPEAVVMFTPEAGGGSSGVTDVDGRFQLTYNSDRQGAVVGKHQVRISTARTSIGEEEDGTSKPATPEVIPVNYNVRSELVYDVVPGPNEIDFALQPGEVIQPETGVGGDL